VESFLQQQFPSIDGNICLSVAPAVALFEEKRA
jgi:hypothetical protein